LARSAEPTGLPACIIPIACMCYFVSNVRYVRSLSRQKGSDSAVGGRAYASCFLVHFNAKPAMLAVRGLDMPTNHSAPKPIQVAAAVIGNALEWYDFIIFGFLTVVIARLFFPADSQYASLLLTTATFGVGFFMRPVGGILLGIYAPPASLHRLPG
jgi:hypothetical protein